jgi:hypothetical protein
MQSRFFSKKKNEGKNFMHTVPTTTGMHAYPNNVRLKKLPQPPRLGFDCAPLDLFVNTRGKHLGIYMHRSTVDTGSIEFFFRHETDNNPVPVVIFGYVNVDRLDFFATRID